MFFFVAIKTYVTNRQILNSKVDYMSIIDSSVSSVQSEVNVLFWARSTKKILRKSASVLWSVNWFQEGKTLKYFSGNSFLWGYGPHCPLLIFLIIPSYLRLWLSPPPSPPKIDFMDPPRRLSDILTLINHHWWSNYC